MAGVRSKHSQLSKQIAIRQCVEALALPWEGLLGIEILNRVPVFVLVRCSRVL